MQKQTVKKISGLALGSSMLLLSMIPAASAFAATAPAVTSVTLTSSVNGSATAGSNVTFTASAAQTGSGTPMYQFWTESPNGTWTATGWSSSNTYTLKNVQTGSYEVVAYAADKGQTTPVSSESTYSNQFVNVGTSLSFTTNANDVAPLSPVTITATAKNFTNVVYQYWIGTPNGNGGYSWVANGDYTTSNTYTFTPPTSGNYKIAVYAKDLNAPQDAQFANAQGGTEAVYGTATGVKLSAATSTLTADGTASDVITASVVDANGNVVKNYSGTATIADSASLIPATGQPSDYNTGTLTFTNGVATFNLGPTQTAGTTDTLTLTPPVATGFAAATLNVTTVAPQVTGLSVKVDPTSPQDLAANSQSQTTVDISTTDAQGNTVGSAAGTYATVTLSGPGSFATGSTPGTAVTSEVVYIPAGTTGGMTPIPVYSIVGETGTVTVSASATGLASASTTIPSYLVGSPASLSVKSSTGTDANGNPYTLYTVTVLDSNGQADPNATGTISVTNNATAQGGSVTTGSVNATTGAFTGGATSFNIVNGVATFAVETNGLDGTNPVTLTITDGTLPAATASYSFTANTAAQLLVTPSSYYTVKPGQTVTFSAQLADAYNNPVAQSGVPVTFGFESTTTQGGFTTMPNGLSSETVNTNANGVASVTFTVPSNSAGGSLELTASSAGINAGAAYASNPVTIESATNTADYATSVALENGTTSTATPVTSVTETASATGKGIQSSTIDAIAQNAVGTAVGNDVFEITSSNPNVVAVTTPQEASTGGVFNVATDLTTGTEGTATVTVKDISNPSMPSASFTVNVTPGTASQVIYEYNGAPIATTGLNVAANTPVLLTVVNADAAGDPIPVTGSTPLTVNVGTSAPNAELLGQVGGGPISSVQIQPGATSATVYLESSVAETVTSSELSATNAAAIPASVTFASTTLASGANTVTVKNSTGQVLANTSVTFTFTAGTDGSDTTTADGTADAAGSMSATSGGSAVTTVTVTTNSSGQATVYYTLPTNADGASDGSGGTPDTITASTGGLTASATYAW